MKRKTKADKKLREIARKHLLRSSSDYLPIKLEGLQPAVFLSFLLSLTDAKDGDFHRSYGVHRSALTYLFTKCEVPPPPGFKEKLKKLMRGLKNSYAHARGTKGLDLTEGKDPMPFEVYRALCQWLIEEGDNESIFGHAFLTLTWNLMCRSRNTVFIRLEHMSWENDAMTVHFSHTKKDQEGADAGHKRHIYANPDQPEICAVLATAKYRATNPSNETGLLIPGNSQYDRFRKLLNRTVKNHAKEIRRLGVDLYPYFCRVLVRSRSKVRIVL